MAGPDDQGAGWERLLATLDADRARAAAAYETLRARLTQRFAWRGAREPEALADATFDRVMVKLLDEELVRDPVRDIVGFVLGVARLVGLEAERKLQAERVALEELRDRPEPDRSEQALHERRVAALEHCLDGLGADERTLIVDYHAGRGQARITRRRRLAEVIAGGLNALRIRVHRLRARLQACVEGRLDGDVKNLGNVSGSVRTRFGGRDHDR